MSRSRRLNRTGAQSTPAPGAAGKAVGQPSEWPAGGVLALMAMSWAWGWVSLGWPWDQLGSYTDALAYLWMAVAIGGSGQGAQLEHAALALYAGRFPPFYPAWLALFGAGLDATGSRAAHLAQALAILLAMLAALVWWSRLLGGRWPMLLALALWLPLPWVLPWSLELGNEALFTALLLAACALARSSPTPGRAFAVALSLGLAALTRSHGLVLLPALWFWLAQPRPRGKPDPIDTVRGLRALVLPSVVFLLPTLLWAVRRRMRLPRGEDDYLREFQRGFEAL